MGVYEKAAPMNLEALARSRQHSHAFSEGNPMAEKNTRRAMALTLVMMVVEIAGGWWFNSMAVLADGWHMSSHALALGLAAFAYACARRYRDDPRFAFGTWKIEILAGYTSAILLLGVAALMAFESIVRVFKPSPIHYPQAIAIAVVGLAVNLLCAWWLRDQHDHHHGHAHDHGHHHDHGHGHPHHHHHDLNQRSAYLHVLADAATSVLAIIALLAGRYMGWVWLDPLMGIVGAIVIARWSWSLMRDTAAVLLDTTDTAIEAEVREFVEGPGDARITDLHVWRIGPDAHSAIVSVTGAVDVATVRDRLRPVHELGHLTVECR